MIALIVGIVIIVAYVLAVCHIANLASNLNLSYGKFFFIGFFLSPVVSGIILICEILEKSVDIKE